jgi:glucose/mannose-6-phosphate isomerase
MQIVQPRLERLEEMLGAPLFESILWGHEYDLDRLEAGLRSRIEAGHFKRIVFYGMGCSSVVSDIVKGFFYDQKIGMQVDVVNDYDLDWFIDRGVLKEDTTLTIIVCYSGWSVEPCLFYETMRQMTGNRNLIVLSGGGKIASLCEEWGSSLIQYKLRHADREYPLYHVQQFFSIFLDLFHKLGITKSTYETELVEVVQYLKTEFHEGTLKQAEALAQRLTDARICLLATANWYGTLLKQCTMFFNEIAMVPTHRNLLHEFSHTEVATYSNPSTRQAIITFTDTDADDYTQNKVRTLEGLFGDKSVPQNENIEFHSIVMDQDNFFKRFFHTHFFMVYTAYYLGRLADVEGRDLISIAAKNPWWSQRNIELFPKCVDIPSVLEPAAVS